MFHNHLSLNTFNSREIFQFLGPENTTVVVENKERITKMTRQEFF